MEYSLGIDIGGTNIAAGVVDESFNIVSKSKVKTNPERGYEEVLRDIALAGELAAREAGLPLDRIKWVGMGCPGTCNIGGIRQQFKMGECTFKAVCGRCSRYSRLHRKRRKRRRARRILCRCGKGCKKRNCHYFGNRTRSGHNN